MWVWVIIIKTTYFRRIDIAFNRRRDVTCPFYKTHRLIYSVSKVTVGNHITCSPIICCDTGPDVNYRAQTINVEQNVLKKIFFFSYKPSANHCLPGVVISEAPRQLEAFPGDNPSLWCGGLAMEARRKNRLICSTSS